MVKSAPVVALLILSVFPSPATALTDELDIGASTGIVTLPSQLGLSVSLEYGGGRLPATFGCEVAALSTTSAHWSVWGRSAPLHASDHAEWGVMAGINGEQYDSASLPRMPLIPPPGLMLGATFQRAWGNWWLRASPSYTLVPDPIFLTGSLWLVGTARAIISGPPWLEVGYSFPGGWQVSLRSMVFPLKVSKTF